MAKVLLLDSPSWKLFNPRLHCHLGILYLADAVRRAGHDVKVLDCHRITGWDGQNLILHRELMEPCDILGVSATTANVNWGAEMVRNWPAKVKVLGGPHVTHIFEGPHAKFKQRKYFADFDYLFAGESEEIFPAFCRAFDHGELESWKWRIIYGVVAWSDFGAIYRGVPPLPDVTKLAPAFDLWEAGFERGALSNASNRHEVDGSQLMTASLYTARGCPYGCTFCADARTKLREETLEQIEKEVAQLAALGVQAIRIQDDTFTIKEERCRSISDILHAYGMQWRACTRVNLRNPDLFRYMHARGCTELGFGIEHGSDRMLKLMAKGTTAAVNSAGVRMCQDAGIVARAFLMLGFPGETEESIQEMENWVLNVRPDSVTLSLFQPFPGSDVWNHPERYSVEIPDGAFERFWQLGGDQDAETLVLKLPTISKERLFWHRQRLISLFEKEIGKLDRTQIHGNVGTFSGALQ